MSSNYKSGQLFDILFSIVKDLACKEHFLNYSYLRKGQNFKSTNEINVFLG